MIETPRSFVPADYRAVRGLWWRSPEARPGGAGAQPGWSSSSRERLCRRTAAGSICEVLSGHLERSRPYDTAGISLGTFPVPRGHRTVPLTQVLGGAVARGLVPAVGACSRQCGSDEPCSR
ncbi:hypothetical protein NDU88_003257 [Pleurodeles waltl]|uniref:Uncharacterized protein n=1 Tax=Pleurodeles waltl TaxID=8319 RepID=A0AAV7QEZ4_PLEWA|nr:hypothetical protein NDU88_003257 [Pleurodeles waltl]